MGVAAEIEERLLGTVRGGRESIGTQPDPGQRGHQGEVVMDAWIEEVLGAAEQEPLQSGEHGGNIGTRPGRIKGGL